MYRERGPFMGSDMNRRIVKGDFSGNATIIGGCRRFSRKDIGLIASENFLPYFFEPVSQILSKC